MHCRDNIDNDLDGYTDCADLDCAVDSEELYVIFERSCSGTTQTPENCLDGSCIGENGINTWCHTSPEYPGLGFCCPEESNLELNFTSAYISCNAPIIELGPCNLINAYWNPDTDIEAGNSVGLFVEGEGNCNGKTLSIEIVESDDLSGDDEVTLSSPPSNMNFVGLMASQSWATEWVSEGGSNPDPEYKFIATLLEDGAEIKSGELKVLEHTEEPICGTETLCKDYLTPTSCEFDACHVGNSSVIEGLCNTTTQCEWNGTGCSKEEEPICDLGGTLGSISIGTCNYEEDTEDDCEDGYLTYNWTGEWDWSLENNFTEAEVNGREGFFLLDGVWRYNPNSDYEECDEGSNLLACPAHIELSFFNWINIVIIILVIGLVYYFLNKKPSKVNSKKSKKSKLKK